MSVSGDWSFPRRLAVVIVLTSGVCSDAAADPVHPVLTWVKRHPLPGAKLPSPRLGYETSYGYDPVRKLLIRYGGHNQGGGGEQNSEVWTYDLEQDRWRLMQPNDAPPGVCCAQQNVFHDAIGCFLRFPAFSGSHGWQWARSIYLKDSSVWAYHLGTNHWTNMRPLPEPQLRPLRGAAYDPHHEVVVIHGGEGAAHGTVVYDAYANTWHFMNPKNTPPRSLSQPGFTYDAVNRVFVLFGSQFRDYPQTWVYDLEANRWDVLDVDQRPPTNKNCAVLAADSRNGVVLATLRRNDDLETWVLDVRRRTWRKLDVKFQPKDELGSGGSRNRVLIYLPDKNLFVMENRVRNEQQIWTFRYAEAPAPPPAPRKLRVSLNREGTRASLQWEDEEQEGRYHIYRAVGEVAWRLRWVRVAAAVPGRHWVDTSLKPGSIHWYRVRRIGKGNLESPPSNLARTQPPLVRGLTLSVLDARKVHLSWEGVEAPGIVGYTVERAPVAVYSTDQIKRIRTRTVPTSDLSVGAIRAIGQFQRLTKEPIRATEFLDTGVSLTGQDRTTTIENPVWQRNWRPSDIVADGKPYRFAVYAYRVRAVNSLGVAGGPSPYRLTIPSAVEYPFAKEEGKGATRLKWRPSRERNLSGYFVYRHNGRFNTSKVVRLNDRPIKKPAFFDPTAGPSTRRYQIVAVDGLGQEGIPSRPVWSRREWQRFYVPYVGAWHQ